MKFLLTNDDGADAPGLRALREAVAGMGEGTVVAPQDALSGCGHTVTTDRWVQLTERGPSDYIVNGTPADCVRVALHRFGRQFDWVLAGINNGGNLGIDVYHSGTVAAAREAALHGLPAIAVSHYHDRPLTDQDWTRAADWAKSVLAELMGRPRPKRAFWNVNFPSLALGASRPQVVFCPLDPSPLPLSFEEDGGTIRYNGKYAQRERKKGSDVDVCFGGGISVSRISLMEFSC